MCYSVDYLFNRLRIRTGRDVSFEEEAFWKNAFNEKILLNINAFLEEMADEISIPYQKPSQIEPTAQSPIPISSNFLNI